MRPPIRVALIDDYDVVLAGLTNMLAGYPGRIEVAELDANEPLATPVDIALFDSFAQADTGRHLDVLVASPLARRVAVYTWTFNPQAIAAAHRAGVDGYLSKTLPARQLVDALEQIHAGRTVVSDAPGSSSRSTTGLNWPGRGEGLTDREAEILALITQGLDNKTIAAETYLAANTIKSYIRNLYRKIGATSRTQAVLWGVAHGFTPDQHRITHFHPTS